MGMTMGMGYEQRQRMSQRPSPSLIQFTEILQLTGQELETVIEQALSENPALEIREMERCPACGDILLRNGTCYRCRRGERLADQAAGAVHEEPDEDFDVWRLVADQRTMQEHLLLEIGTVVDDEDMPIAEFIVGELDDRGFLDMPCARIAASLHVDVDRVEHVLDVLQHVGPLGVGARSTKECLLLQLDRWEEAGAGHPLARPLIEEHMDALAAGRYREIADALGVTYDEVVGARDYIRSHLRPYPIAERADMDPWDRDTSPALAAPDVIIRHADEGGFEVEVVGSRRHALALNPIYRELAAGPSRTVPDDAAKPDRELSDEEKEHVQEQVQRASQFLTHLRERRDTMSRVALYVAKRQAGYLHEGPRALRPLTRADVAEALDLHESTISRATAGKWVMLPNRQVVPFSTFFKAALSAQEILRELVENEDEPLTDSELAELMAQRGHRIARRTVAKYRNQLGILPSSTR